MKHLWGSLRIRWLILAFIAKFPEILLMLNLIINKNDPEILVFLRTEVTTLTVA